MNSQHLTSLLSCPSSPPKRFLSPSHEPNSCPTPADLTFLCCWGLLSTARGRAEPTPPTPSAGPRLHVPGNCLCSALTAPASARSWKNAHAWISLLKFTVPQNPIKQPKSIQLFMYSRIRTAGPGIYFGLVPVTVTIPWSVFHFSAIQLKVKFKPSYSPWTHKDETFIGL